LSPQKAACQSRLEEIALRYVGAYVRDDLAQLVAGSGDRRGVLARCCKLRRAGEQVFVRRCVATADDRERKGGEYRRIHGGVPCCRQVLGSGAGEALVEVQVYSPMPGGGKEGLGDSTALILLQKRSGQPQRLEAMPECTQFGVLLREPDVVCWRSRPFVKEPAAVECIVP
jgi:hypothetical protein